VILCEPKPTLLLNKNATIEEFAPDRTEFLFAGIRNFGPCDGTLPNHKAIFDQSPRGVCILAMAEKGLSGPPTGERFKHRITKH